jgi:hypothetical protein
LYFFVAFLLRLLFVCGLDFNFRLAIELNGDAITRLRRYNNDCSFHFSNDRTFLGPIEERRSRELFNEMDHISVT